MILALAYTTHDSRNTLRLIKWMGFLSDANDFQLKQEQILLVASRAVSTTDRHRQICAMAAEVFGRAYCHVPDTEHEVGWPGAANFMFSEALNHAEQFFKDDVLWLESDATTVRRGWLSDIYSDWDLAGNRGKTFMGALVPHSINHMTGIAVYGKSWRNVAPRLVTCPDHDAWDCWAAADTLPNCHYTDLIQHVFKRHDKFWSVPTLGIVGGRTAIFHQDKSGKLLEMLDGRDFGGECFRHPLYGYAQLSYPDKVMMKFYHAANATKNHKSAGYEFKFTTLEPFGGSTPGVLYSDNEDQQIALGYLTSNPATGITEIDQGEFEKLTKKKLMPDQIGRTTSQVSMPVYPPVALTPTPSKSPAALVEARPSSEPGEGRVDLNAVTSINEVIKTGKVPVPPVEAIPRVSRRPRKPQSP